MRTNYKMLLAGLVALTFASCTKKSTTNTPTSVNKTSEYNFTRNASTTVSFSGQSDRLSMLDELMAYVTDFSKAVDSTTIDNMLRNSESPFLSSSLNMSTKNMLSKVAASADYFKSNTVASNREKSVLLSLAALQEYVYTQRANTASSGVAGKLTIGSETMYVDTQGIVISQLIKMKVVGAMSLDQILNNYLSTSVLDAGTNRENNTNEVLVSGKNYTAMEHYFDEAYGYFIGSASIKSGYINPSGITVTDNYLFNDVKQVAKNPSFSNIDNEIFDAFLRAREAIVNKDYVTRDNQIKIIREKLSTIIAVRAVHYFQSAKFKIAASQRAEALKDMSAGISYFSALTFSRKPDVKEPYFSSAEVIVSLNSLANLWTVTDQELDELSNKIASKFPFTVSQAAL